MSFHGGIGAAIIYGGFIEGATIVGSSIQTAQTPPYVEMGPSILNNVGGGTFPALSFVSLYSARYDDTTPSLSYADTPGVIKALYLTNGSAIADGGGNQIVLHSSDDPVSPDQIDINAAQLNIAVGLSGIIDILTGHIVDQHANIVPSFQNVTGTYVTNASGIITIPHGFGTTNVIPFGMLNTPTNGYFQLANRTTANVTLQIRATTTGASIGNGVSCAFFGIIADMSG